MQDLIVEKGDKQFVDVVKLLPDQTSEIRKIIKEVNEDKVTIYTRIKAQGKGRGSKKIIINRFIELNELFFEGLGLWQAEGSKDKGLYFGNTCSEMLLRFIEFTEKRLGLHRDQFKVTISVPKILDEEEIKRRWSKILSISLDHFTRVSLKPKTNLEFVQLYVNSVVLVELMKNLHKKLQSIILRNKSFNVAYMKGIIAGEGSIHLKKTGVISHLAISGVDMSYIEFFKKCLKLLGISFGKYMDKRSAFPIYGKRSHEKVLKLKLCTLQPNKNRKFESGFNKYQRDIMKSKEMEKLILKEVDHGLKTYNEIAKALKKGRSTIQFHYIPVLKKKGLIKKMGKERQAWLFGITDNGLKLLENNTN